MRTLLSVLALSFVPVASATVWELDPSESIQATVHLAAPGDTVLLGDGTYTESVVFYGKPLTIASWFMMDGDTNHIAATVVVPDTTRTDTNSCFVYAYGEPVEGKLVGLTLRDGRGTYASELDGKAGGAVFAWRAAMTMEDCRVSGSRTPNGAGMAFIGGTESRAARGIIRNSVFYDCMAELRQGGIMGNRCSLYVADCLFEGDTSGGAEGGLGIIQYYGIVERCTFRRCSGSMTGAFSEIGATGWISDCLFEENATHDVEGGISHFMLYDSDAPVTRCVFRHNTVSEHALAIDGRCHPLRFYGNVVEDNSIADRGAGTVLIFDQTVGEITYNVFRNNVSRVGGNLWCLSQSAPRIHHNYFDGNICVEPGRASVVTSVSFARPTLDSNWISGNQGPTVDYDEPPVTIHAEHNWWGDASGPYHPTRNPNGRGDTLTCDSVIFEPWLTSPPDTSAPQGVSHREVTGSLSTWRLAALYPNPFNSEMQVVIAGFTDAHFSIGLYNILGQRADVVHSGSLTGGTIHYQAPIWLAAGVYIVCASDGRSTESQKVVFLK